MVPQESALGYLRKTQNIRKGGNLHPLKGDFRTRWGRTLGGSWADSGIHIGDIHGT